MTDIVQIPAVGNIRMFRGDVRLLLVTITDDAETPAPIDLTGYTITATVHAIDGAADVELDIDETDLEEGEFSIELTTAGLIDGLHTWCLVLTPPGDPVLPRTYIAGTYSVEDCG